MPLVGRSSLLEGSDVSFLAVTASFTGPDRFELLPFSLGLATAEILSEMASLLAFRALKKDARLALADKLLV